MGSDFGAYSGDFGGLLAGFGLVLFVFGVEVVVQVQVVVLGGVFGRLGMHYNITFLGIFIAVSEGFDGLDGFLDEFVSSKSLLFMSPLLFPLV